jgi:hypothetical protein
MKPQNVSRIRLERYAWMVALVVVLRLAAWDLHHALDLHDYEADAQCDVCMVVERGSAPLAAGSLNAPHPLAEPAPGGRLPADLRATPAPNPPPRGPPSILS